MEAERLKRLVEAVDQGITYRNYLLTLVLVVSAAIAIFFVAYLKKVPAPI